MVPVLAIDEIAGLLGGGAISFLAAGAVVALFDAVKS